MQLFISHFARTLFPHRGNAFIIWTNVRVDDAAIIVQEAVLLIWFFAEQVTQEDPLPVVVNGNDSPGSLLSRSLRKILSLWLSIVTTHLVLY